MKRLDHARAALDNGSANDWDGSDPLCELVKHRYAAVIERDDDSWVLGFDTPGRLAQIVLGTYTDTEGYDEWVTSVIDLDTGERVLFTVEVAATVTLAGASGRASTHA